MPFMFAIKGPDGAAYIEECCVAANPEQLHREVNALNDSPDTGYSIVPVYLISPQDSASAERERAARLALQWSNARGPEHGGNALRNYAQALRDGVDVCDHEASDYHWSKAPQQHAQAALSDDDIKAIAIDYAQHVAADIYDVTKYDCAEDFFNCVRAIVSSQQPAAALTAPTPASLTTLLQAAGAMRLVRCHDGSGDPFEAYDKNIADRVVAEQRAQVHALEAKIDALMLEYCPSEMTAEQVENWGNHQRAAAPAVQVQEDEQFDWMKAELIRDEDHVDEALRAFREDPTGDNATGIIQAALTVWNADLRAALASQASKGAGPEVVYQVLSQEDGDWYDVPKEQYDRCNPKYRRTYTAAPSPAQAQPVADAEPSARDQKLAARVCWTTKQWYEHVGAWENEHDQIVFGSVMALRAMMVQFQDVSLYAASKRAAQASTAQGDALSQQAADAARYRELRDHGLFVVSASRVGWAIRRDEAPSTPEEMDAAMDEHMIVNARALAAKPADAKGGA
jgi:hypothetical protein